MKRFIPFLLALILCFTFVPTIALPTAEAADVTISSTNFPDATFRAYVKDNFDTDGNGKFSSTEIAAVDNIDISYSSVTSLKGVEYFTALTLLECSNNKLTSLDVSKNTKLENLYCDCNQLTSLNLASNTKLIVLFCGENKLTSLDVSKNTALTDLSCWGNQLTKLSVSGNPALSYLSCSDNGLTTLSVTGNTALTWLVCSNNQLTSLNVTKNTKLEQLYCEGNKLTSLDVSKNTKLESLFCDYNQLTGLDVTANTLLTSLTCSCNPLKTLNVTKNTALTTLSCYDTQLSSLNLAKNTKLESLYCEGNQLTSLDLSKNTKLVHISCEDNQLTSLDLSTNAKLETLYCERNKLTGLDVSKNTALKYLFCGSNPMTSLKLGANTALCNLDAYDTNLKYLDLSQATLLRNVVLNGEMFDYGSVKSYSDNTSYLYVDKPTVLVTTRTASRTAEVGATAKFYVVAKSDEALTYQWQYKSATGTSWINSGMTGSKTPTLSVPVTAARNGYRYRCVITTESGTKCYLLSGLLTVKPAITAQPSNKSGYVGDTAKFTIKATGVDLTYRWQYYTGSTWKNSGLTGHDTATLSVAITEARNGQKYRCVVEDANGAKLISSTAKLTVKPKITSQPADKTTTAGTTVKFTVKAAGAGLTYRWQYRTSSTGTWKNSGATGCSTATLTIQATAARNGYQYRCVIEDANGTKLISSAAKLTVK